MCRKGAWAVRTANTSELVQAKRIHTCVAPGCKKRPSFGQAQASATRCSQHKIPGDVDVVNLMCKALGCTRGAIFGGPDTAWSRTFCKRHCHLSHLNLAYLRPWNLTAAGLRNSTLPLPLALQPREANELTYGCTEQQAYSSTRLVASIPLTSVGPSEQASSLETWWGQAGLCMAPTELPTTEHAAMLNHRVPHNDKAFGAGLCTAASGLSTWLASPSLLTEPAPANNGMWGSGNKMVGDNNMLADTMPQFIGAWVPPPSPGAVPRTPGGSLDAAALGLDLALLAPPPLSLDTTFESEGWTAESGVLIQTSISSTSSKSKTLETLPIECEPVPDPSIGASPFSQGLCTEQVGTKTSRQEELATARQEELATAPLRPESSHACAPFALSAVPAAGQKTRDGEKGEKRRKAGGAPTEQPSQCNASAAATRGMRRMLHCDACCMLLCRCRAPTPDYCFRSLVLRQNW